MPIKTKSKTKRFFVSLDLATYKILEETAKKTGYVRASNLARSIIFDHMVKISLDRFESTMAIPLKLKKERKKK